MASKPQLPHRPTSDTLNEHRQSDFETKETSLEPSRKTSGNPPKNKETVPTLVERRIYDTSLLAVITITLFLPWIFWGIVFHLDGIQAHDRLASIVKKNPHATNYFVTLIGNLVSLLIGILFTFSIVRWAQEWLAVSNKITVFHVSILSALRYRISPWGLSDLKRGFQPAKLLPVVLAGVFLNAFAFVPSAVTSLLAPVPLNKNANLSGTELNFSSTASECTQFFNANPLDNNCDWQAYKGVQYTNCRGENQLVDVLESGRGNMLSLLPNHTGSLTFGQLGNGAGLHFLGPIRGILPIGPDGVPAFDTLQPSPFSNNRTRASMLSYNYTLEHQGFTSNVTCIYDTQSPIKFGRVEGQGDTVLQYNGTCEDPKADVLHHNNVPTFTSVNADNGLGYWACKSPLGLQQEPTYYVYLTGRSNYTESIGNITCTISPIKPAIFPITYRSQPGVFSVENPNTTAPAAYPQLIELALVSLGGIINESQNWQTNLVAEAVITTAVKSFGLPPYERSHHDQTLPLFGAMIQGILEYLLTYTRLIYSTVDNAPLSCIREVRGTITYQVLGWSVTIEHVGFLMPMTLINLTSLVFIIVAMAMTKGVARDFDPVDVRSLLPAFVEQGQEPEDLDSTVQYLRSLVDD